MSEAKWREFEDDPGFRHDQWFRSDRHPDYSFGCYATEGYTRHGPRCAYREPMTIAGLPKGEPVDTGSPGSYVDLPKGAEMANHPHQPNGREPMHCSLPGCEMTQAQHPERATSSLPRVIWQGERLRVVEVRTTLDGPEGKVWINGLRRAFLVERKGDPDALGVSGWSAAERVTPDECVEAILSLVEGER